MTATHRSSGRPRLTILLVSVAVAAIVPVGVLAAVLPRPVFPPPPVLSIESVTISPDPPVPYWSVVVTVRLSRGGSSLSVGLGYVATFGSQGGGGMSMDPAGAGTFRATLGPFSPGTEVWFIVAVSAHGESPLRSNGTVFQVGSVPRGGPSGLTISNVTRAPLQPRPYDDVIVRATVRTNATFTRVAVQTLEMSAGVAYGMERQMDPSGGDYTTFLYTIPDTRVAYRVIAQDDTGNTAVSNVFMYTVPPATVP